MSRTQRGDTDTLTTSLLVLLADFDFFLHSDHVTLKILLAWLSRRSAQSYRAVIYYSQGGVASILLRQRTHAQKDVDFHGGSSCRGS